MTKTTPEFRGIAEVLYASICNWARADDEASNQNAEEAISEIQSALKVAYEAGENNAKA